MKAFSVILLIFSVCSAFISVTDFSKANKEIPFPKGFRNWTHVKTSIAGFQRTEPQKYDGFHHIYANDKAMIGYRTGHFPDGSTIVFDVQQIVTEKTDIKSGTRKFIDIIYKDSAQFQETGGWGFEEFMLDSQTEGRLTVKQQQNCFNCHASKKETGYVFSQFRE